MCLREQSNRAPFLCAKRSRLSSVIFTPTTCQALAHEGAVVAGLNYFPKY